MLKRITYKTLALTAVLASANAAALAQDLTMCGAGVGVPPGPWAKNSSSIYSTNPGNVGIGTSDPTEKLEVNGNIKANNLFLGGQSLQEIFISVNQPNSVNGGMIVDGTITSADIDGSIQKTVQNSCTGPNQSIKTINQDGTVTCETDDTGLAGVANVNAGPGISVLGSPQSPIISIPTNGVTSAMINDGAIKLVDINTSQVQARVAGTCAVGSAISSINADGTVECQPGSAVNSFGKKGTKLSCYSTAADFAPVYPYFKTGESGSGSNPLNHLCAVQGIGSVVAGRDTSGQSQTGDPDCWIVDGYGVNACVVVQSQADMNQFPTLTTQQCMDRVLAYINAQNIDGYLGGWSVESFISLQGTNAACGTDPNGTNDPSSERIQMFLKR
jgi:hypothetical protein